MTTSTLDQRAYVLGAAGLIPFLGIPIINLLDITALSVFTYQTFITYSAIILSFFGGVHWLHALTNPESESNQIYWAMVPSVFGWLTISFVPIEHQLTLLVAGYILIYLLDTWLLAIPEAWKRSYWRLRQMLTAGACIGHVMMLFALS